MKSLFGFFILLFLIGCKEEKTFADDIVLSFPKNEQLTFQEFNEATEEFEKSIMYVGKDTSIINVKYFRIPPLPLASNYKLDSSYIKKQELISSYFNGEFHRTKYSNKSIPFDSLSENNIEISIKIKDTIPHYAYNNQTKELKKYKAFPTFIKNISGKKLILHVFQNFQIAFLNKQNKWQIIRNDNFMRCCNDNWNHRYWEFYPNEIMVISVNFLTGKEKGKFKVWTGNTSSEEFEMNYDKKTIDYQRDTYFVK